MSEKEKMLKGEWYDANFDQDLIEERRKAELFCYDFNMSRPGSDEQISALKNLLGGVLPEGVTVLAPVYFDYGINTHFGQGSFINHNCYFMDGAIINIGKNVFIGPSCGFYTANHLLKYADRNKGLEKALPITIGDNCWFGAGVIVLPGVTIGNGCVIAAGSVVADDIPDNCLVAGVPAVIKKQIEQ